MADELIELYICPCCGKGGITRELLNVIERLRCLMDGRLKINSGYRCEKHNKDVGGSPTSSHMKGVACDVHIPSSRYRCDCIFNLLFLGVDRIGIGNSYIHFDIDQNKPNRVVWLEGH
jgi:hypothetical protein